MSSNSFLVDSGSKGWCNIYAENITAYNDLNVGGDIIQNGNVIDIPNANNDIEVRDLTAHGQVTLLNDDNNNGDIVFQIFGGNANPLVIVDAVNEEVGITNTTVDGTLTANEINVNGNAFILPNGDIGTDNNIECGALQVGNNSSIINKFDTTNMNLNIPTNALVSDASTIGFSAFRMGNISQGGHSLVNIIVDLKDDIQTNNATGVITLNAIPNIYRPNNPAVTTVILDYNSVVEIEKATLGVNGVITINQTNDDDLIGDGNPIRILSNIVFTFDQIGQ